MQILNRYWFELLSCCAIIVVNVILLVVQTDVPPYVNLDTININILTITTIVLIYHARASLAQSKASLAQSKASLAQSNSSEINTIFQISGDIAKKIEDYKKVLRKCNNNPESEEIRSDLKYMFGEIVDLVEIIAQVHNKKKFGNVSSEIMAEAIIPIINVLVRDERMVEMKNDQPDISRENTFQEMFEFSKKQMKKGTMDRETVMLFEKIME